jgi:hydroxymethylbilane synthase
LAPDVQIADIRGNVDSRLRKLEEAKYDAIILAAAGLTRLKLLQHVTELLPQDRILPAIGQGALGLECRQEDESTIDAVLQLNDPDSFAAVTAERSLLASLLAGCLAPVAALATVRSNQLTLQARVCATDGSRMIEGTHGGLVEEAELIGADLAERLRADGAEELIALARR